VLPQSEPLGPTSNPRPPRHRRHQKPRPRRPAKPRFQAPGEWSGL